MTTTTCQFCSAPLASGASFACCVLAARTRALTLLVAEPDEDKRDALREQLSLVVGPIEDEDIFAAQYTADYDAVVADVRAAAERMRRLSAEYGDGVYDARRHRALASLNAAMSTLGEEYEG